MVLSFVLFLIVLPLSFGAWLPVAKIQADPGIWSSEDWLDIEPGEDEKISWIPSDVGWWSWLGFNNDEKAAWHPWVESPENEKPPINLRGQLCDYVKDLYKISINNLKYKICEWFKQQDSKKVEGCEVN